jgi:hypothetical protein
MAAIISSSPCTVDAEITEQRALPSPSAKARAQRTSKPRRKAVLEAAGLFVLITVAISLELRLPLAKERILAMDSPQSPEAEIGHRVEDLWEVAEPQLSPSDKLNSCFEDISVASFPRTHPSQGTPSSHQPPPPVQINARAS